VRYENVKPYCSAPDDKNDYQRDSQPLLPNQRWAMAGRRISWHNIIEWLLRHNE
jgi:hypothetical protein